MIKADYHLHSSFSGDCQTPMEEQIKRAIELGIEDLCFTEHLDLDYPEHYGYFSLEIDKYIEELKSMKEKYKDKIKIHLGIEFGLEPGLAKRYKTLAKKYPFDFIIGSTHLINWEDPYYPDFWKGKTRQQGITDYFNTVLLNIKSYDEYDTLGHLDYIIRYANMPKNPNRNKELYFDNFLYKEYEEVLDEILSYIIKKDKALEVNSAGYKYGLGAPNPGYCVLGRYKELGGSLITIGSDAHKPEHIGHEFKKINKLLTGVGFDKYTIFINREPVFLPLN